MVPKLLQLFHSRLLVAPGPIVGSVGGDVRGVDATLERRRPTLGQRPRLLDGIEGDLLAAGAFLDHQNAVVVVVVIVVVLVIFLILANELK